VLVVVGVLVVVVLMVVVLTVVLVLVWYLWFGCYWYCCSFGCNCRCISCFGWWWWSWRWWWSWHCCCSCWCWCFLLSFVVSSKNRPFRPSRSGALFNVLKPKSCTTTQSFEPWDNHIQYWYIPTLGPSSFFFMLDSALRVVCRGQTSAPRCSTVLVSFARISHLNVVCFFDGTPSRRICRHSIDGSLSKCAYSRSDGLTPKKGACPANVPVSTCTLRRNVRESRAQWCSSPPLPSRAHYVTAPRGRVGASLPAGFQ